MNRKISRLFFISTIFIFCGCGSLTHRARHQYVLVQSNPSGATVYEKGKYLGTTPAFVEVRRAKDAELTVGFSDEQKRVRLDTRYRWNSFWSNLIWLTFAPVGWVVDLATGGANTLSDPPTVKMEKPHKVTKQIPVAAIAPPQSMSLARTDDAGTIWSEKLPLYYPNVRFVPYKSSLGEFTVYGYDYNSRPSRETEYELFGRLDADEVFESEFRETDSGIELYGRFRNVFTGAKTKEHKLTAAPWGPNERRPWHERWNRFFHLIPNTVGIELSSNDTNIETNENGKMTTYKGKPAGRPTGIAQLFPLFSALSITRQEPPRMDGAGKFTFAFVPAVRVSFKRVEFPDFTAIQGYDFSYMQLGAGIGPEGGYQWGPHYVYLNIIPIWAWHRLAWANEGLHLASIGAITIRGELGYLYFLNQNYSFRLFTKSTQTPPQIWNSAIQNIAPGAPKIDSGVDVSAGLLFAYTFAPRRKLRQWTADSKLQR